MKVDERSENRLVIRDGYILKMPVEAAVALLDPLFENVRIGRMNGKTRMLYNRHSAWCTIKAALGLTIPKVPEKEDKDANS